VKNVSAEATEVWLSGDYSTDDRRPMARATIQKLHMHLVDYTVRRSKTRDWAHDGKWATAPFGQSGRPRELHNIKSVKWQRGVDTDVASCTIVLYNVGLANNDRPKANEAEFDLPGFFTPNRGEDAFFSRWNYESNRWKNWLVPDRVIRTYEGYGFDNDRSPEKDPHMYPSGVWLIDDVEFGTDGLITINCRDFGRLLIDHILFPPVVPWSIYPLWWDAYKDKQKPDQAIPATGDWQRPTYSTDSNRPYVGSGITDGGQTYVNGDGSVYGHHGRDAFDASGETYWLSVGNRPEWSSAYEYVQGRMSMQDVAGVKVNVRGGPYRMYVSLWGEDDEGVEKWFGRAKIPYRANQVDTSADIPYVAAFDVGQGETETFALPRTYKQVTKIRYTFSRLWDSGLGVNFRHRAAVQGVFYANEVTTAVDGTSYKLGNYGDYTDIVKWLCAWAGFYWPRSGSGLAFQTNSDGTKNTIAPASDDPALGKGRVWGDFEQVATTGIAKFDVDVWDKKPVMDGITAIRDIVGFDFWIDETGGVIWRMPNVWEKGNYLMPEEGGARSRTSEIVTIDERTTLMDLRAKISSRNVREKVFIGNIGGKFGAVVKGYNPVPSGMRRVGGWTDQRFESEDECETMADLIALRQSWLYRQNSITITANPAIQVDDQVRIYERISGEGYLHRVLNISSDFDNDNGTWTYQLTTHWLGERAFTKWAFDPERLSASTKRYLRALGKL
jgi:hypothetical protein